MKHAGRAIGKYLGAGLAGSAKSAVTGGLAYYGQKALAARVKFLQDHPMAGPAAMIVVGHVAKKKFPVAGCALVGAGAYGAALARDLNKMAQSSSPSSQISSAASGTNALIAPDDIRALIAPDDIRGFDVDYGGAPQMDTSSAMNLGT
jgi:hypothetical protein